jgi:hypothetical protein
MDCQAIYNEAMQAGLNAGNDHQPNPMIVSQHTNPLNDNSPVVQSWQVSGGACGFAWVNIRPATSQFARWLKKTGKVDHVAYEGGYNIWCSHFGQSMERKEKWAEAVASVLHKNGIKAYSRSRMD